VSTRLAELDWSYFQFPVRLLPEEKDVVDDAMANPKFNSSIFGGEVANRDLRRLRPGTWLNDEVITFYSCMINERAKPVREGTKLSEGVERLNLLNAYSVSSFWYGKLSNEGWTKPLSRWTKKASYRSDHVSFDAGAAC